MASADMLFIAPSAYLLGGVQSWLADTVVGLRKHGITARLALVSGRHHDEARYLRHWPMLAPAMPVRNATGSPEGRVRALMACIEESGSRMVVSVNIADCFDAVARLRARGRDIRLVMTLHALDADYLGDIAGECAWLDAVVATNRLSVVRAVGAGMAPERVFYAPYGVDVETLQVACARREAALHLRLGYCGRVEETQKRFRDVVAVTERLVQAGLVFELVIAGSGPSEREARPRLERLLGDRLRWLGTLPKEELPSRFYAAIDLLILTSDWETGPIVAWEAMASGVVVVTSRFDGLEEEGTLRDGETALTFPVGDCEAAAAIIEKLAAAPGASIRAAIVPTARRTVAERYERAVSVAAWREALERAATLPLRPVAGRRDWARGRPSGRLDRLLGVAFAETIRGRLGRRFLHHDPGGEWPHAHHR